MSTIGGEGGTGPADNRPLTDQEYQLLQRLFSDPLSFPLTFKAWLVSYLETSDMTLPMNSILGLQKTLDTAAAAAQGLASLPAGMILPYGGAIPPAGGLLCDGNAYSRVTDARLFSAIGTAYGAPDGSSFNVPNMQGRVPVGKGSHATVNALGLDEGAPPGNRRPGHNHSQVGWDVVNVVAAAGVQVVGGNTPGTQGLHTHGPADAPTNAPAFSVVNFIIVR